MKRSRIVTLTLAASFIASAFVARHQNTVMAAQDEVIREQASTLALYERGAESLVKNYESASLRASMALAAYDRCRGLRGVSAP